PIYTCWNSLLRAYCCVHSPLLIYIFAKLSSQGRLPLVGTERKPLKHDARHPPENLLSYKDEVRGESGVSRHCPRPPEPAWTRLKRIQHTLVYWEHRGKSASIRWQVTSHHFPFLVSLLWVTQKGAHA